MLTLYQGYQDGADDGGGDDGGGDDGGDQNIDMFRRTKTYIWVST